MDEEDSPTVISPEPLRQDKAQCDELFLFSCVAAVLAASRDHDLILSCLEEAFARCESGKTLKSQRVARTIERILLTLSDPVARDVDTMRSFFISAGLGFQEATRCAQVAIKNSIPSPMKLALLVARDGSKCLRVFSLSEEDDSLILLAIRSTYTSPARRRSRGLSWGGPNDAEANGAAATSERERRRSNQRSAPYRHPKSSFDILH